MFDVSFLIWACQVRVSRLVDAVQSTYMNVYQRD